MGGLVGVEQEKDDLAPADVIAINDDVHTEKELDKSV